MQPLGGGGLVDCPRKLCAREMRQPLAVPRLETAIFVLQLKVANARLCSRDQAVERRRAAARRCPISKRHDSRRHAFAHRENVIALGGLVFLGGSMLAAVCMMMMVMVVSVGIVRMLPAVDRVMRLCANVRRLMLVVQRMVAASRVVVTVMYDIVMNVGAHVHVATAATAAASVLSKRHRLAVGRSRFLRRLG